MILRLQFVILLLSAGVGITAAVAQVPYNAGQSESLLTPPRSSFEFFLRDSGVSRREFPSDPLAADRWSWRRGAGKPDMVVELEELQAALEHSATPAEDIPKILSVYRHYRKEVRPPDQQQPRRADLAPHEKLGGDYAYRMRNSVWVQEPFLNLPKSDADDWDLVPAEFKFYAEGAHHFWNDDRAKARDTWMRVLALPENQRRYRSVWAAWMLGKTQPDLEKAKPWFEKTVALSKDPAFHDGLRLRDHAEAWLLPPPDKELGPGTVRRIQGNWPLFLRGNDRGLIELTRCSYNPPIFERLPDKAANLILAEPGARVLVFGFSHNERDPFFLGHEHSLREEVRIEELRKMGEPYPPYDVIEKIAGRDDLLPGERTDLATAAYAEGLFKLARRLVAAEPSPREQTVWLQAKLAAWDKDFAAALELLEGIKGSFLERSPRRPIPQPYRREVQPRLSFYGMDIVLGLRRYQFWEDLGTLRLTSGDIEGALDAFWEGDAKQWAAYLMQHVMTTGQATAYVDQRFPDFVDVEAKPGSSPYHPYGLFAFEDQLANEARHFLARRLAAEDDYEKAAEYFGENFRGPALAIASRLKIGRDESKDKAIRAEAMWDAARLVHGYKYILGTIPPQTTRLPQSLWELALRDGKDATAKRPQLLLPIPPKETEQLVRDNWPGEYRGQVKFDAARFAWEAAELMPDNDRQCALVLLNAGYWIMYERPEVADRFYKALVRRHRALHLGQQADAKRWFPRKELQNYPADDEHFEALLKELDLPERREYARAYRYWYWYHSVW